MSFLAGKGETGGGRGVGVLSDNGVYRFTEGMRTPTPTISSNHRRPAQMVAAMETVCMQEQAAVASLQQ